jgi:hypothetical protein
MRNCASGNLEIADRRFRVVRNDGATQKEGPREAGLLD